MHGSNWRSSAVQLLDRLRLQQTPPKMPNLARIAALLSLCTNSASADPGFYVVTAYDSAGQRSVELRYWTVKARGRPETVWPEFGVAYGINSRWTTRLFASGIGRANGPIALSTWNWSNDVLLTQGQWPVDLALHTQLIKNRRGDYTTVAEFGPALQTDLGRTQINFNLFLERTLSSTPTKATQLKYQWQLRHRLLPALHVGAQGFGELGEWDRWAPGGQQSHRAGPAAFGLLRLNDRESFKLHAAWLVGKTFQRRGHMFSMQLSHDF